MMLSNSLSRDAHGFSWLLMDVPRDFDEFVDDFFLHGFWMEPLEFPVSALHLAVIAVPGALFIQPGYPLLTHHFPSGHVEFHAFIVFPKEQWFW